METNPRWESVERGDITDYFVADIRYTVGSTKAIRKKKLAQLDFRYKNTPFDIRFTISSEEPVAKTMPISEANYVRKKKRTTFRHKFWNYDISKVETTDNGVSETTNEVELDIIVGPDMDWRYVIHSSLLKVTDIVGMCEKIEPTASLQFIGAQEKRK